MKLNNDKINFKMAPWVARNNNLRNKLSVCLETKEENHENLWRVGQSQDLQDPYFWPAVRQRKEYGGLAVYSVMRSPEFMASSGQYSANCDIFPLMGDWPSIVLCGVLSLWPVWGSTVLIVTCFPLGKSDMMYLLQRASGPVGHLASNTSFSGKEFTLSALHPLSWARIAQSV
jgi:hypothetical protein